MKALFIFLISIPVFALQQNQCPTVDLTGSFPTNLDEFKTENLCWADATTDLMNFALRREGGQRIPPTDVALKALTTPARDLRKVAELAGDWSLVKPIGLLARDAKYVAAISRGMPTLLRAGNVAQAVLAYDLAGGVCPRSRLADSKETMDRLYSELNGAVAHPLSPNAVSRTDVDAILKAKECDELPKWINNFEELRRKTNDHALEEFQQIVDKACGKRSSMPILLPAGSNFSPALASPAAAYMANLLATGIPLAVTLQRPDFLKKMDPVAHEAVAIGARWNRKRKTCEFKLRNSWGSSCRQYASPYNSPENCDNGNVWVSEDAINMHVAQVLYLVTPQKK